MKFRYLPHVLVPVTAVVFGVALVILAEQEQPPVLGDAVVFDRPAPPAPPLPTAAPSTGSSPRPKVEATTSRSEPMSPKTAAAEPSPTPSFPTRSQPRVLNQAPVSPGSTPSSSPPSGESDDDGDDGSDG
ncbi:hypothetical protein [Saccharopolyspora mangrovi]|uniref:Small hydrophilic protein n=1 Tax=Saccharopolyspora mangrovi TaxID=3082379 RepID=A0ABU6A4D1_9PSEU|nr:hypothetical protein [Saccharopolyspora sp. S2-29]MEB3366403.1 hypothetical protein [Saccharopolyspora sp. S2-29]